MTKEEFKNKYFNNTFYWVSEDNFEKLQEVAVDVGLIWHTGDTDILPFIEYSQRNLWMSSEGYFQAVNFWTPDASYGEPANFGEMVEAFEGLTS